MAHGLKRCRVWRKVRVPVPVAVVTLFYNNSGKAECCKYVEDSSGIQFMKCKCRQGEDDTFHWSRKCPTTTTRANALLEPRIMNRRKRKATASADLSSLHKHYDWYRSISTSLLYLSTLSSSFTSIALEGPEPQPSIFLLFCFWLTVTGQVASIWTCWPTSEDSNHCSWE